METQLESQLQQVVDHSYEILKDIIDSNDSYFIDENTFKNKLNPLTNVIDNLTLTQINTLPRSTKTYTELESLSFIQQLREIIIARNADIEKLTLTENLILLSIVYNKVITEGNIENETVENLNDIKQPTCIELLPYMLEKEEIKIYEL